MRSEPEVFLDAVCKYLANTQLDPSANSDPEILHPEQDPFTGINLDISINQESQSPPIKGAKPTMAPDAEFIPATEEERVRYDLYKNHATSYAMILNMLFKTDDKTGRMRITPIDPQGYFPYLIDFKN